MEVESGGILVMRDQRLWVCKENFWKPLVTIFFEDMNSEFRKAIMEYIVHVIVIGGKDYGGN